LSSSLAKADLGPGAGKRCRRSWSPEEKRRIVEEASRPGASVAEIARRYGLNANLVFNWRREAQSSSRSVADVAARGPALPGGEVAGVSAEAGFIPLGVFTRTKDEGAAADAGASPSVLTRASSERAIGPRPRTDERAGVIEIDLVDGTRLRVDAFVNERALRRVLAVLKAAS